MSRPLPQRIAIVGASGQLGTALRLELGARAIPLNHSQIEITDPARTRSALTAVQPDLVINAAAYNWVDKAEDEPVAAYQVNALGPRNLALTCAALTIPLLHVSSDYVFGFDTCNLPWIETAAPGPVSAYGLSKLAGEYFVRSLCPQHYVVRTCGLYGQADAVGKGNFVKTMLRVGLERGHVRVVNDQHCTPTSTVDLAAALVQLIETDAFGLYHATNQGATTWYDFACEIFRVANLPVQVEPISTEQFGARARRPAYSVLNCDRLHQLLNRPLPTWQAAVAGYIPTVYPQAQCFRP